MQVPKVIRPPTDATPAETVAARGRPALPDDFLREASTRLGIMALVAAGLWVVGTILGRLTARDRGSLMNGVLADRHAVIDAVRRLDRR